MDVHLPKATAGNNTRPVSFVMDVNDGTSCVSGQHRNAAGMRKCQATRTEGRENLLLWVEVSTGRSWVIPLICQSFIFRVSSAGAVTLPHTISSEVHVYGIFLLEERGGSPVYLHSCHCMKENLTVQQESRVNEMWENVFPHKRDFPVKRILLSNMGPAEHVSLCTGSC